jgi:pimeloyl-ACP methyl ester carboxylesterase
MSEIEHPESPSLSRRGLIGGALAAGAASALVGVPGASAAVQGSAAGAGAKAKPEKRPATVFFKNEALNFQMLFAIGGAGYGASEVGEVLATFDRIHAKGDTFRATYEEFLRLGRQTRVRADKERAGGRLVSARSSCLRAAMYLDQALFYTLASKTPTRRQEGVVYSEMEAAFARAAALFEPRFEAVRIPWDGGTIPGWFLSPGGKGARPTVILNNGSDAQNIDMYVYGGAAALERGWNALIIEGPGQGGNLFLRSQVFIPEWERVITPVVDFLRARPEVDGRRIALIGQSFGGYLVARAAMHERRVAALVTDTGVTDVFYDWEKELPHSLLELLAAGKADEFDHIWDEIPSQLSESERFGVAKRSEIYGNGGGFERMSNARHFKMTRAEARQITLPTAITAPALEAYFPGQQERLHRWLGKSSTLLKFTVAEGAEYHCEPMAPQLRNERVFDWLEATV